MKTINKKFWNIIVSYSYEKFFNSFNFYLVNNIRWERINLNKIYQYNLKYFNNIYYRPYIPWISNTDDF